jgi:hypothetical protein
MTDAKLQLRNDKWRRALCARRFSIGLYCLLQNEIIAMNYLI